MCANAERRGADRPKEAEMSSNSKVAVAVIAAVLVVDQLFKIWVKTHFALGEEVCVLGDWFRLHFVENNGMAFGMELSGSSWGKLALSIFRLAAIGFIGWGLVRLCREEGRRGLVVCISLVLAGAVGNIIDSVFYGVVFSSSWGQVAEFLPADGGYGSWLHGRVVDMLYFPLIEGVYPDWVPFVGGRTFLFFRPVFNIADSAICVGIFLLLVFYHKDLSAVLSDAKSADDGKAENAAR